LLPLILGRWDGVLVLAKLSESKLKYPSTHPLELASVEDFSSNSYDRHYSDDVLSNHSAFYNVTVNQVFYSRNTINQINQILFKWCCSTL